MTVDETLGEKAPQQGVSGKRLTFFVLLSLLLVGVGISYVLWTYNRIDSARRETESAWQAMVDDLAGRYRALEMEVAQRTDDERFDMAKAERFRLAIDGFRTTAQPELQIPYAQEIEACLVGAEFVSAPEDELDQAVSGYNTAIAVHQDLIGSPAGRFLSLFLNFPESNELQLAR